VIIKEKPLFIFKAYIYVYIYSVLNKTQVDYSNAYIN